MDARAKLFGMRKPYETVQSDETFLRAMRENCAYQYAHCPQYRAILDACGFFPRMLRQMEDLAALPALPTLLFKRHELFSMPHRRYLVEATSSGTRGQMSRIGFELSGLWYGLQMVLTVGQYHRLFSLIPANYIVLGYKPHKGNETAVTKTARGLTYFAPPLRRAYALKYEGDGYRVDLDGLIESLLRFSRSRFPVRLIGFPSYMYFLLQRMEARGIRLQLKKGSRIMLGGGWKQFYKEQVDKRTFYALAERVLGIPESMIVEFFGAVEHPILYTDCRNHRFHLPVYGRVLIRDTKTLEPVENGQVGLVNLLTPMVLGTPILSVMTDDLGILHDGKDCGCGARSPWLEIIGRVGLREVKTCAAGAAELLAEEKK